MRCLACDCILSPKEDERTFRESNVRVSLCNSCAIWIDQPMVGGDDIQVVDQYDPLDEDMESAPDTDRDED